MARVYVSDGKEKKTLVLRLRFGLDVESIVDALRAHNFTEVNLKSINELNIKGMVLADDLGDSFLERRLCRALRYYADELEPISLELGGIQRTSFLDLENIFNDLRDKKKRAQQEMKDANEREHQRWIDDNEKQRQRFIKNWKLELKETFFAWKPQRKQKPLLQQPPSLQQNQSKCYGRHNYLRR